MHLVADRKGNISEENSLQDAFLEKLYCSRSGRTFLRILISPAVSKLGGWLLGLGASKGWIPGFIRRHGVNMAEYEPKKYTSYNDFFTRRLVKGARKVEMTPGVLVSPCDSRVSVYEINDHCVFPVKHTFYTVESLLRDAGLAREFAGGHVWVFRLCVEDYHRYIFVDGGSLVRENVKIPGVFHTVNPVANDNFPIYKENTREYSLLASDNFGRLIQMEVGAMLVGRIENHHRGEKIRRGWEKGRFAFGGSTVIVITSKGAVCPDRDILINSRKGIETKVKLGERVGVTVQ